VFKGIARFLVATAAGAGLGAAAALVRRHLLGSAALSEAATWTPDETAMPYAPEPQASPAAPPIEPERRRVTPADVADLDAARARLRQRAAELRAEMEG
jgi:hypothetical protein